MRSFEGQFSDNKPIHRTRDEKRRLLRELEETLAGMKPHASPSLREALRTRIRALRAELAPRPG
ncbi:hypothetical protein LPC08_10170 [Roseomonas sp. OT10]|uniref:hypothetical protein n=1 Tax=Roseomonas cutis TaxID=2897332 RepID=UPI001E4E9D04|nr:hypothetical protein [Roseomonas sp. OT10]UFN50943.1 hypothetical protein LPC08_10170 [Roseomonas sp. OT10]